ncbi:YafY family protein [Roseomonas sp. 18066]|uniref:helix-turn-helix transcriptional regulator n=1 Tax=Roseomonas sp. 18066 TaxID=2681412 RepID=UPI001356B910|nr:YafY family protein [Roseomonas sp. 18066]
MSRSARLLGLLQELQGRRRPVTAQALAEAAGVSLRTLYRDIETLRGQGAAIEGEAGLGYLLRPGFFLPPLAFDEDEAEALLLGLRWVARRGDPALAGAAESAFGKLVAILPPAVEAAAAGSGLVAGPGQVAHLAVLRQAMRQECKLQIDYADKAGAATQRVIWPLAVGFFTGAEVLAAWCELRQDHRHFRLDRMQAVALLPDRLPRRRAVLLAEWRLAQAIEAADRN